MKLNHTARLLWVSKDALTVTRNPNIISTTFKLGCQSNFFLTSSHQGQKNNEKPFSSALTDRFERRHNYLRISLTERCNLRCLYCMPEEGVPLSPPPTQLTSTEIYLLSYIFVSQGVTKIRLTGGEPTIREDILSLVNRLGSLRPHGLQELCLTTNGISLHRKLDSLVSAGLTGINISLDTLDPLQFQIITRRNGLEAVQRSIARVIEIKNLGASIRLKINCVVIRGINDLEIISFVDLGRENDLEVRFIEYMPFDGNKWNRNRMFSFKEILDVIKSKYPRLIKVQDGQNDTSKTYKIPGFVGRIGFITSMTHNFCTSCNRLRITSDGNLKVCLFGKAEVSLRDIIRKGNNGQPIGENFLAAKTRLIPQGQSARMSADIIHRVLPKKDLLEVISTAVRNKKEKHDGMGELEKTKNRPMILIDKIPTKFSWAFASQNFFARQPWYQRRLYSDSKPINELTHLTPSGTANIVSISHKPSTHRIAVAVCCLKFSNPNVVPLIRSNAIKKGDVLSVARIAAIMAAKKTSDLIPLCHPIAITHVNVHLESKLEKTRGKSAINENKSKDMQISENDFGKIEISVKVECYGKTGAEMEAMTAASIAGLTIYDMCKSVDKRMRIDGLRIVRKEGGVSGPWSEDGKTG
ncbi:hypothetical protein Golomagni_02918 [Golovinomyces magnicellulatus]|nr:hypothetical protein Golomagni_02918 [Golovinomyces magnicellulatus]